MPHQQLRSYGNRATAKSHLSDCRSRRSNPRPLVYNVSGLSTIPQRLLKSEIILKSFTHAILTPSNIIILGSCTVESLTNLMNFCFISGLYFKTILASAEYIFFITYLRLDSISLCFLVLPEDNSSWKR